MEWSSVLWTVAQIMVGEMMPVAVAAVIAAAFHGWQYFDYQQHRRRIAELERRIADNAIAT